MKQQILHLYGLGWTPRNIAFELKRSKQYVNAVIKDYKSISVYFGQKNESYYEDEMFYMGYENLKRFFRLPQQVINYSRNFPELRLHPNGK